MTSDSLTLKDVLSPEFDRKTAVVLPSPSLLVTYAVLRRQVESLAETLHRGGIRPGDPVSIVLPNGLEYLATFLAVT